MKKKLFNRIMAFCLSSVMILSNCSSMASAVYAKEDVVVNTTTDAVEETSEEVTTEDITTEEATTEEISTEEESTEIVFDHFYNDDADVSNIKSKDLFVQVDDAAVFTKNTNVVSNYGDVYIISCKSVEEAQYVYSYYVDKVSFICDLQNTVELSDDEENTDVADLSDVNKDSEDAIGNLENNIDEAIDALSDVKEKDYSDYIAIIDSGINEEDVTLDDKDVALSVIGDDTNDTIGHGTKMYQYVKEEYPDAKIMAIKAFDKKTTDVASIYAAIKLAIENKVAIINLSFVGVDVEDNAIIKEVIQEAIDNKITVIGAAGNASQSAKEYIPGCIDDVITVGAVNEDGTLYKTSNYDADLYVVATSTSEATARYSGIFASGKDSDKVYKTYNKNTNENESNETDSNWEKYDINKATLVSNFKFNIKYTFVDQTMVSNNDTLDTINSSNADSLLFQAEEMPLIYKQDDVYMCKVDAPYKNNVANNDIIDYVFTNSNVYGEVIDDPSKVYFNNNIAYFKDVFSEDGGQLQVVIPINQEATADINVNYYIDNVKLDSTVINEDIFWTFGLDLNNFELTKTNVDKVLINGREIKYNIDDENILSSDVPIAIINSMDIYLHDLSENQKFILANTSTTSTSFTTFHNDVNGLDGAKREKYLGENKTNLITKYSTGKTRKLSGVSFYNNGINNVISKDSGTYYLDTGSIGNTQPYNAKFSLYKQNWDINMTCCHAGTTINGFSWVTTLKAQPTSAHFRVLKIGTYTSNNNNKYKYAIVNIHADQSTWSGQNAISTIMVYTKIVADQAIVKINKKIINETTGSTANGADIWFALFSKNKTRDDSTLVGFVHTNGDGNGARIYTWKAIYHEAHGVIANDKWYNDTTSFTDSGMFNNVVFNKSSNNPKTNKVTTGSGNNAVTTTYYYFDGGVSNTNTYYGTISSKWVENDDPLYLQELGIIRSNANDPISAVVGKDANATSYPGAAFYLASSYDKNADKYYFNYGGAKKEDKDALGTPPTAGSTVTFTYPKDAVGNVASVLLKDETYAIPAKDYGNEDYDELEDPVPPTYISVLKTDPAGNKLDAEFEIYNNGNKVIPSRNLIVGDYNASSQRYTTIDGRLVLAVPGGTGHNYTAKEVSCPYYKVNANPVALTVFDSKTLTSIADYDYDLDWYIQSGYAVQSTQVTNQPYHVTFSGTKVTKNGTAKHNTPGVTINAKVTVPGAGEVYNNSGQTNDDGILSVTLESNIFNTYKYETRPTYMNYTLTETGAPAYIWNYRDANGNYPNRNATKTGTINFSQISAVADTTISIGEFPNNNAYRIAIKKSPETTNCVDVNGNPNYDLTGATYKVYKTQAQANADTNAILTFTVDKDGYSVPQDIYAYMDKNANGSPKTTTFWVKEVTPGARGYKLNPDAESFDVKADHTSESTYTIGNTIYYGTTVHNTKDEPVEDPARIFVRKLDGFGNESTALQGTVKLKYTFYKSAMYDTILSRNDLINNYSADIVPEYSGTLTTNSTNTFDTSGWIFPRGYLVIDEVEWPKDYTGDKSVNIILADGKTINITNDFYFVTDKILSDNGLTEDMATWYPNGETTYADLLKDDTKAIRVQDGDNTNLEIRMSDPNVRGDIELYKYNEITGEPMEGVKFSITNRFTGEKHYIYTDKNGHATTKVEYDPNKTYLENYGHINYYDTVDDYDSTITDATVWFGWTKDYNNENATDAEKIVTPDRWQFDFPGAVWGSEDADDLFGTYIVKEERCAANTNVTIDGETYKYQLLLPYNSVHVTNMNEVKLVYDDNALRAENKNYNTKLPEIYTKARVIETSNDVEETSDDGTVTTVKDYSQTLANNSTKDIIPANSNNTETTTDANDDANNNASKVIDYTDQTIEDDVFYDKLRAGTTYAVLSELKVITETLDDNGKPTGEITIDDAIDRDGNVCKQMTKFTTKANYDLSVYEIKGTHTVRFEHIDPTGLDEKCQYYVVYETIYLDEDYSDLAALEKAIANKTFKTRYDEYTEKDDMDFFPIVHTDEKDEAQTIWPNVLHTTVANNPTVDHVANAEDKVRITDRVYYKGLTVGKEYTITGDLVIKEGTDFTTITYDPTNEKADADGFVTVTTATEETSDGNEWVHPDGPANNNNNTDANNNNDTDANTNANTDNNNTEANTEANNTEFEQNPNKAYFLRDADGNVITASTTIKIESEEQRNGYVDIVFEFNASELEGKSTVVFEKLEYGNKIINIHADLNDEDQTIHFPKIGTSTRNGAIKAENIISDETAKENTTTENTTNANETTNNETTTTNETNTNNETNTTTTDTNTTAQTDNVTKLDIGKAVAKEVKASDGESFIDTIHYDNLLANRTYHAYGKLMNKETGEVMKDAAGKEIVADVIFKTNEVSAVVIDKAPLSVNYVLENGTILDLTADRADYRCDGDVELEFKGYDFTNLANKIGVVFEEIYLVKDTSDKFINSEGNEVETGTEVLVGSHKDIKDITQFIYFAKIGTNAKDSTTDIPLVPYGMDTVLKDTVNYENLIPGKEYTLTANIAVKDDTSGTYKDGELLKDANGEIIVATTKFIPTAENSTINADGTASGSTLVEIPFNTTGLKGVKLVAFEDMSNMYGISIATHMDINDEGQTVRVPGGYTTVVDDETQSQIVATDEEMTVTDTIYYENLIPGKEYTATGTVYVKETGEQLMVDGQPVTSTVTFTPTDSTGTVKVPFTINTSDLYTKHLVFFEDVTYNNITVFVHHDLNDDKQTLTVEMVMNIKVAKADKDNIKYFIKGAEITIYNEDGTIAKDINGENCVGITDENGNVSFKVVYREDNTYYAQETKAPNGYAINNEKFKITATGEKDADHCDIIKVTILDEAIVIPPKTGDILLITMICLVALGALGIFVYRRKKSKVD